VVGVEAVVGYLTVYLLRGAHRVANSAFDALVDRLARAVETRLGSGALDDLARNPRDPITRNHIRRQVEAQAAVDSEFASALEAMVAELDRQGGQAVINEVYAEHNVQVFGSGMAAGRDLVYAPTDVRIPDPSDLSGAPGWVKLFLTAGFVTAVTGIGIFFYTLLTDMPDLNDPSFGETPRGIPIAFAVFFVGFGIAATGAIGRALSKQR
jgi:hypothetical protein